MPDFQLSEEARRRLKAQAWTAVKLFYREMRIWKPRWLKIAEAERLAELWERDLLRKEQQKYEAACSASSRPT